MGSSGASPEKVALPISVWPTRKSFLLSLAGKAHLIVMFFSSLLQTEGVYLNLIYPTWRALSGHETPLQALIWYYHYHYIKCAQHIYDILVLT